MRKTIILFAFLFCTVVMLRAQPSEVVLVDRFGAIRADMVRDFCTLVGFSDTASLKLINNESLKAFKKQVRNDTIKKIIASVPPLFGEDINQYVLNLRRTREMFLEQIDQYYPSKKVEAEACFIKYFNRIDSVTCEINSPVESTNKKTSNAAKSPDDSKSLQKEESKFFSNNGHFQEVLWGAIVALAFVIAISFISRKRKPRHTKPIHDSEKKEGFNLLNEKNSIQQADDFLVVNETKEQSEERILPETKTQPETKNDIQQNFIQMDGKGCSTAADGNEWIVVGASVQGNGHIEMDIPCQDNHAYEYLSDGWGIAIVSDGAGSAKLSHKGSAAIVKRSMVHFKSLITQEGWISKKTLPSDGEWMKLSYRVLKQIHGEIAALSKHLDCEPRDLNATVIVVIHSPLGLLSAHVGDGRAGYRDLDGNWHSLIIPHKGEEANQTIFMMSGFWNIPFFEMSGVMVPETKVLQTPVTAFTLMSDGCEHTAWLCNQHNDETGKYYDPNLPYAKFFNSLGETLQSFREDNISLEERQKKWFNFIKNGNPSFVKETDDKTMILATIYNSPEKP